MILDTELAIRMMYIYFNCLQQLLKFGLIVCSKGKLQIWFTCQEKKNADLSPKIAQKNIFCIIFFVSFRIPAHLST